MVTSPRAASPRAPTDAATRDASAAAQRAGVTIRTLHLPEEHAQGAALVARVWRSTDTAALDSGLLRALAHTGNFVAGAFVAGEIVGFSVGFRTGHPVAGLHSHITCTAEDRRSGGLGYALKLHQRAWALAEGLTTVTWTFDPLARRNAYFNLSKLAADAWEYLPNFYGPMGDGLNAGDESDRLLMTWPVNADPVAPRVCDFPGDEDTVGLAAGPDGEPLRLRAAGERIGLQVPADIIGMRAQDPSLALRWRHALRSALSDTFADGYRIVGFTRSGYYVLSRTPAG